MAKRIVLLGILIMALVFGMTIVGCDEEEAATGGTISVINNSSTTYELRILNGSGENIRAGYRRLCDEGIFC